METHIDFRNILEIMQILDGAKKTPGLKKTRGNIS
jgi:hypothetical protein